MELTVLILAILAICAPAIAALVQLVRLSRPRLGERELVTRECANQGRG